MSGEPQDQGRNRNGQFRPGQSGNPAGRPAGRSLTASIRRELDREYFEKADPYDPLAKPEATGRTRREQVARTLVDQATGGDLKAAAFVDKHDGQGRVDLDLPAMTDAAGCDAASARVFAALGTGRLSVDQARQISDMIEQRRRAIKTLDLDSRLSALEAEHRESEEWKR